MRLLNLSRYTPIAIDVCFGQAILLIILRSEASPQSLTLNMLFALGFDGKDCGNR